MRGVWHGAVLISGEWMVRSGKFLDIILLVHLVLSMLLMCSRIDLNYISLLYYYHSVMCMFRLNGVVWKGKQFYNTF